MHIPTIDDVRQAANVMAQHLSPAPLVRSHALEKELGLPEHRRVWLKDYGWTPVGSFGCWGHSTGWITIGSGLATDRWRLILRAILPRAFPLQACATASALLSDAGKCTANQV